MNNKDRIHQFKTGRTCIGKALNGCPNCPYDTSRDNDCPAYTPVDVNISYVNATRKISLTVFDDVFAGCC